MKLILKTTIAALGLGVLAMLNGCDPINDEPGPRITFEAEMPQMVMVETQNSFFAADTTMGMGTQSQANRQFVKLSRYYISKYEITNIQFKVYLQATNQLNQERYYQTNSALATVDTIADHLPVVGISHTEAQDYCKWLSEQTGQSYRLPTEAEWEFAAKGGVQSQGFVVIDSTNQRQAFYTYAGSDDADQVGQVRNSGTVQVRAVGQLQPNELGLYDLTGNAAEWCADYYHDDYWENDSTLRTNPVNTTPTNFLVIRGGSITGPVAITQRGGAQNSSVNFVGFRVVRDAQ